MKFPHEVQFSLSIETPLSHPEESVIETYVGRANVTVDREDENEFRSNPIEHHVEITYLWLALDVIDISGESHTSFRKVNVPNSVAPHSLSLRGKLEVAAIDCLYNPEQIGLPDEVCAPLDVTGLEPHRLVKPNNV